MKCPLLTVGPQGRNSIFGSGSFGRTISKASQINHNYFVCFRIWYSCMECINYNHEFLMVEYRVSFYKHGGTQSIYNRECLSPISYIDFQYLAQSSTEKKIGSIINNFWVRFFHVFIIKYFLNLFKNTVVSTLKSCILSLS